MKEGSLFILFVSHVDEIFEIRVSLAIRSLYCGKVFDD
jgi:hypothetical protein